MEFRLLGPLAVTDDEGRPLDAGQPMQRALLAMLALQIGHALSVDSLTDGLWGDDPPATAGNSIQVYVSRLRKVLEPGVRIINAGGGYCLEGRADAVDVTRFEQRAADARAALARGEITNAVASFRNALALHRGPALDEFVDRPFATGAARRLQRMVDAVQEDLVDARLALGEHADLLAEIERLVAADRLSERRWGQLMTALYLSGRQAEALGAYQRARAVLVDELGLEPGPELRRIEADILNQSLPQPRPLPRGAVTFFLTDVEGSVRLWERAPEAMALAMARHDELARQIVEAHGGLLRKARGEGDSTFSVFVSAIDAVRAATAFQLAVDAELRSDALPLTVRAVVHTGEAQLRDADYYGPAVNRAARVRGVARGRQVLVTESTAAIVRDALSDGAGLRDLGEHQLRDMARPEHLFQLTHPDFDDDDAPLPSPPSAVTLPSRSSSFVGREREIDDITALLADARLVTLTGAGGCGKTSLAIEVAALSAPDHHDGVIFVDLAPVGSDDLVANAFAAAFGIRARPGRTLSESVADYLGQQSCLAVVDNCEHVTESVRAIVDAALRAGPAVRVLATSREHLGLTGEVTWLVPPLDRDVAVRLFDARAVAAAPTFDAHDQRAAVERLCARLDDLPLAIELAAARVSVLSVDQIIERVDKSLQLLGDVGTAAPTRQQTLRATFEWSHTLLSEPEQELFARLAVFAGGFTLEAVEAIAKTAGAPSEDVVGYFVRLVDKSLVLRTDASGADEPRYRMLEPVRQFANEMLVATGADRATRDQHLEYVTDLVEAVEPHLYRRGARRWTDRLERETANIDAALDWAFSGSGDPDLGVRIVGALSWAWFSAGRIAEGTAWSEAALRSTAGRRTVGRSGALYTAALIASSRSDFDAMTTYNDELWQLADELGLLRFQGIVRDMRGIACWVGGATEESLVLFESAIAIYDECGDRFNAALCCSELGRSFAELGRRDEAQLAFTNAMRRASALGEDAALGFALDASAVFALSGGDTDHAARLIAEAIEHYRQSGYQEGVASGLNTRAATALAQGDDGSAATDFREAVTVGRRLGHVGSVASSLDGLADVAERGGDPLLAAECAAAAEGLRVRAGITQPPDDRSVRQELVARVRAVVATDEFHRAWERGAAITLDQIPQLTGRNLDLGVPV